MPHTVLAAVATEAKQIGGIKIAPLEFSANERTQTKQVNKS